MPSVSIILPLHNRAAELPQTLDSLVAQTSADWEAIIVDDHSTDGATAIAERYAAQDARFKVVKLLDPKRGAPAARNFGLSRAHGTLILFLDSDDLLSPTCIEQRIQYMRNRAANLDFAVWKCQLFREQPGDVPQLWNADTGENDLDRLLRSDVPWQTTSPIWRRAALDRLSLGGGQFWDESVLSGQDWEFHIRAVALGLRYERVDVTDCHWRLAGPSRDSIGKSSFGKEHARARPAVVRKMHDFLKSNGLLDERRQRYFAAMYLNAADTIAERISRVDGRAVWREAYDLGLCDKHRFTQGDRYLFWKRSPASARRRWNRIRLTWPRDMLPTRGTFFNVAPVDAKRAPTVSVVMSAYNNADYIETAVQSILNQSYRDFEFIILNDGSTDGTGELLRQLADTDCRIRLISRENKGLTVSLNEGLSLARGKYIARMDSDDLALRERFEKQVAYLDAHPECVLLGTKVMLIDPLGVEIVEGEFHHGHEQLDAALLNGNGASIYHPSVMMRKNALDRAGGYESRFNGAEDVELFLRLAEIGSIENLSDILLQYRRHPASVNHTKHVKQFKLMIELLDIARARRGMPSIDPNDVRRWTPEPAATQFRQFGWNAMKRKRIDVARSHAIAALKLQPLSLESWRLAYCAWRGR